MTEVANTELNNGVIDKTAVRCLVSGQAGFTLHGMYSRLSVNGVAEILDDEGVWRDYSDIAYCFTTVSQKPLTTIRETVLKDAQNLITGDRQKEYGTPEDNFTRIARGWSILFGITVEPYQVALAMDWLKTARLMNNPADRDGWVDKAGYTGLGAELSLRSSDD